MPIPNGINEDKLFKNIVTNVHGTPETLAAAILLLRVWSRKLLVNILFFAVSGEFARGVQNVRIRLDGDNAYLAISASDVIEVRLVLDEVRIATVLGLTAIRGSVTGVIINETLDVTGAMQARRVKRAPPVRGVWTCRSDGSRGSFSALALGVDACLALP